MSKKKVTFADIAKYTGFSKTTISRYFNDPDSLTLENQEKIAKALDELVFVSSDQKELEQQYLDELMAYKIEGLIVLSHTFPSEKLASYHIPLVAIEREAEHICSVNTDNYMGAVQAATLLIRNQCEILIHVNVPVPKQIQERKKVFFSPMIPMQIFF